MEFRSMSFSAFSDIDVSFSFLRVFPALHFVYVLNFSPGSLHLFRLSSGQNRPVISELVSNKILKKYALTIKSIYAHHNNITQSINFERTGFRYRFMNQAAAVTYSNSKVQPGKLKEWEYVCNDPLRQEAHIALKQEYDAALEFARSDKLTLEEGRFIKRLGESYCYSFNVSQLTIQAYQADRPHRLEIGGKHIDGSISAAGDGVIEIEIASNLGNILHLI